MVVPISQSSFRKVGRLETFSMARKWKCVILTLSLISNIDTSFPSDLPKPEDDGLCDHLAGMTVPRDISLAPTSNPSEKVNLSKLSGLTIVFCYPRTGAPAEKVPPDWDAIPGARGCTPQACSFRDNMPALKRLGVDHLFGCSTQDSKYQSEVKERVHLTYDLLSDNHLELQRALSLPTFEYQGETLTRRLTLAIEDGKIVKHWYPIFPPDSNVKFVLEWLENGRK